MQRNSTIHIIYALFVHELCALIMTHVEQGEGGFICVSPPHCHSYMRLYPLSIFQVSTHTSPIEHTSPAHTAIVQHSGTIAAATQGISARTPVRSQLIELYSTHLAVVRLFWRK